MLLTVELAAPLPCTHPCVSCLGQIGESPVHVLFARPYGRRVTINTHPRKSLWTKGQSAKLTTKLLLEVARELVTELNAHPLDKLPSKLTGTTIEEQLHTMLEERCDHIRGNAAKGLDLPTISYDIKVTHINKPQSSAAYSSAAEKVYGLGYGILLLTYELKAGKLHFLDPVLIRRGETADFRMTRELRAMHVAHVPQAVYTAYLRGSGLAFQGGELEALGKRLRGEKPPLGQLGLTYTPQWRVRYGRVLARARNKSVTTPTPALAQVA